MSHQTLLNKMEQYMIKALKFIGIFLFAIMLNGCEEEEDGTGVILAIAAAGAAAALHNELKDVGTDASDENGTSSEDTSETAQPHFTIKSKKYDGNSDDLLTAGFGQNLPTTVFRATDAGNPTAAEIRKATIINQHQALQDMRTESGYGSLYGPSVATRFEGKVAGKEYLAYDDDGSGQKNVTMMVQVPDNFNPKNSCIVAAPSPGSRGVYGAIATVGEWGLKNRCAVAYTDKGTGNGVHDLFTDTVNLIDGKRGYADDVGNQANFRAQGTPEMDLAAYNSTYPSRIAQKHAHSQQNPEADWGKNVLDAVTFAFYVLNLEDNFGKPTTTSSDGEEKMTIKSAITSANTIVIASGTSTGGSASLRAVEQDTQGLIDGVVVAAPIITIDLQSDEGITIQQGNKTFSYQRDRKPVFDVITYYNIYQPCASATTTGLPERCTALYRKGLLSDFNLDQQIIEAQNLLNKYGTLETTNAIAHNYEAAFVYASFSNLYANAYGGFSVVDNLCGYSYAGTDTDTDSSREASPIAKNLSDLADDFQMGNGIPPSSDTHLINNNGNNGEGINFRHSINANGIQDGYLEGALCLRQLATGRTGITTGSGTPLTGIASAHYQRVQEGIKKTLASGNLQGKPAIIVQGRDDALAHVNFSARAYYGLNKSTKSNSKLAYIEVKNANHFDGLNQQNNVGSQIPLHYYLSKALDSMYDHLKNDVNLPKSQVIPTVPTASTGKRMPKIAGDGSCPITFSNKVLTIPEC
ncbi:3-hydroxybutyrate oligomer hydrolase family protein [Candidatus Parabeggiatoa sp. HSG14]|uniref:3-hydroxybutyrate oligomer hydrolase family protein n=1 Tax=Candidatus Parabeggiatoa sp. HSG14 TaxID=3055593 RepID=UPI0025A87EAC|nr:3-hydroxybutyrate oligomer hydrolase family protein [Thiotrichales bacterium HSG14]